MFKFYSFDSYKTLYKSESLFRKQINWEYNIISKNKLLLPEIIVEARGVKSNYFGVDLELLK